MPIRNSKYNNEAIPAVIQLEKEGHMAEAKAVKQLYEAKEPEVVSDWDDLMQAASDGMHGKNPGVPMGFSRLNNHISIRPSMYFLLGGYTGLI